jgi:hypothetical protein
VQDGFEMRLANPTAPANPGSAFVAGDGLMELQPALAGMPAKLVDEGEFIARSRTVKERDMTAGPRMQQMVGHGAEGSDASAAGDEQHACSREILRKDERPDRTLDLDEYSGCKLWQVRAGLPGIVHGHEHLEAAGFVRAMWSGGDGIWPALDSSRRTDEDRLARSERQHRLVHIEHEESGARRGVQDVQQRRRDD